MVTYINYTYPDVNGTNVANLGGMFVWANQVTSGGFGLGILLSFFIISFGSMMAYTGDVRKTLAPVSFMTTIIAAMLRGMDVVTNDYFIMIGVVITALSTVWLYYGE